MSWLQDIRPTNLARGLNGSSFRSRPEMAEERRPYNQAFASEPHRNLQCEGGIGGHQAHRSRPLDRIKFTLETKQRVKLIKND